MHIITVDIFLTNNVEFSKCHICDYTIHNLVLILGTNKRYESKNVFIYRGFLLESSNIITGKLAAGNFNWSTGIPSV